MKNWNAQESFHFGVSWVLFTFAHAIIVFTKINKNYKHFLLKIQMFFEKTLESYAGETPSMCKFNNKTTVTFFFPSLFLFPLIIMMMMTMSDSQRNKRGQLTPAMLESVI